MHRFGGEISAERNGVISIIVRFSFVYGGDEIFCIIANNMLDCISDF